MTVQWDAPVGSAVDNYHVAIFPLPPSGAPPPTADTQTILTLQYNVLYLLNITGTNCLGPGDMVTYTFNLGKVSNVELI